MNFIPDPPEKKIRLTVKLQSGKLASLDDEVLPKIKDDTIIDIIFPAYSIEKETDFKRLTTPKEKAVLKKETAVLCKLYDSRDGKTHKIPIVLLDDLRIFYKGDESLGRCMPCKCWFKDQYDKKIQVGSLNEAYTRLSEIYQRTRKSHSGNIFQKVYYQNKEGTYHSLSHLRDGAKHGQWRRSEGATS